MWIGPFWIKWQGWRYSKLWRIKVFEHAVSAVPFGLEISYVRKPYRTMKNKPLYKSEQ